MIFRPLTVRALGALLVLLTIAAYVPAIRAGYVWDDDTLLTANPQMRSVEGLAQIWRGENSRDYTPVTLTGFWVERQIFGENPTGYHVVNILLHAVAAVLLWLILARLGVPGAWLGALLFAIHPVNVASVAWIAELKNTLSGVFFFGSILSWLVAREGNRRWAYASSVGMFVLAALSKGAVVTLPAVLLLCMVWKDRKITMRGLVELIPYVLVAIGAAVLTVLYQSRAPHYGGVLPDSAAYRISRAGGEIWIYLGSLFWPAELSPMRAPWVADLRSPIAYLPAVPAAVLAAIVFWKRRTWGRPFFFAGGYYVVMLVPVLGFVWMALLQETPGTDWWQYLAAPGVFACVAAGAVTAARKWRVVTPLIAVIVALLIVQTWRRASIYQDMTRYCRAVTAEDPAAWTLQNNLGIMLKREGRFVESEACYRRALIDNPGYVEAHINLGNTLGAEGDSGAAEAEYREAMKMRAGDAESLQPLADLLFAEGRLGEALPIQVAAVKAAPGNVTGICKLGELLGRSGRFREAAAVFHDAAAMEPGSIPIRIELCEALVAGGDKDSALLVCTEVDVLARESGDANALDVAAKLRRDCEGGAGR